MSRLIHGYKYTIRRFTSSSHIQNKPIIGKPLTINEIQNLFNKSNEIEQVSDNLLGEDDDGKVIDEEQFNRLMELSGLSSSCLSEVEKSEMLQNLNDKLKFINKLHSIELSETSNQSGIQRLMNDNLQDKLSYSDLISEIAKDRPSPLKGETLSSWNPFNLSRKFEKIKYEKEEEENYNPLLELENKNNSVPKDDGKDQYFIVNEGLIKENKQ